MQFTCVCVCLCDTSVGGLYSCARAVRTLTLGLGGTQLKNFNTLFEIMTGLSHNSIYRHARPPSPCPSVSRLADADHTAAHPPSHRLKSLFDALPRSMHATYQSLCEVVHYKNNYRCVGRAARAARRLCTTSLARGAGRTAWRWPRRRRKDSP